MNGTGNLKASILPQYFNLQPGLNAVNIKGTDGVAFRTEHQARRPLPWRWHLGPIAGKPTSNAHAVPLARQRAVRRP